jgi:hypothetical protein
MDTRDWLVIALMAGIQIAGTAFIFKHPDTMNFVTWGTLCGTLTGAYHWMVIKDSKQKDAD